MLPPSCGSLAGFFSSTGAGGGGAGAAAASVTVSVDAPSVVGVSVAAGSPAAGVSWESSEVSASFTFSTLLGSSDRLRNETPY